MVGMMPGDALGSGLVKTRTTLATNSEAVAAMMAKFQCDHSHRHIAILACKAKRCQEYPELFCRALCEAYSRQVMLDKAREREGLISTVWGMEAVAVTGIIAPLVAGELSSAEYGQFGACEAAGSIHRCARDVESAAYCCFAPRESVDNSPVVDSPEVVVQNGFFSGCCHRSVTEVVGWIGGVSARPTVETDGGGRNCRGGTGGTVGTQGIVG